VEKNINNKAFYTFVLAQLFSVFNIPEGKLSFFKNEVPRNPWVWAAIALSIAITFGANQISLS
jgi:Ca2+-transporting ATPase